MRRCTAVVSTAPATTAETPYTVSNGHSGQKFIAGADGGAAERRWWRPVEGDVDKPSNASTPSTNRAPKTARTRIRRLGSLTGAIAAVVTLGSSAATAATPVATDRSGLIIDGAVTHRSHLTVRELTRLPQQTVTLTFQGGSGAQTHTYTGPLLLDVLNQARPRFDPQVKADSLRHVITATGSDQHQAALAWAEIDPEFAGKAVLVALTEDGKPAADGRPRVVVPGDKRGGRYVASLVRLHLSASSRR